MCGVTMGSCHTLGTTAGSPDLYIMASEDRVSPCEFPFVTVTVRTSESKTEASRAAVCSVSTEACQQPSWHHAPILQMRTLRPRVWINLCKTYSSWVVERDWDSGLTDPKPMLFRTSFLQ